MRIPRSLQLLPERATTHLYWRAHNKEFYLSDPKIKGLYLNCCRKALGKVNKTIQQVTIQGYCLMSNHVHLDVAYEEGSSGLSSWMRQCHGRFGATYNRIHKRSGKVAEGRPKTSLIENSEHLMKAHFYIEANPIRAGLCKLENLHLQKFSSYRFYAYGIQDEFTQLLSVPKWYVELGRTPKQRQAKYRKLFSAYLRTSGTKIELYRSALIGSALWRLQQTKVIQKILQERSHRVDPLKSG